MSDSKPSPVTIGLKIQADQVRRVAEALGAGDVSECKSTEVKHTVEVLALLLVIEEIAPGVIGEVLNTLAAHYIKQLRRDTIATEAAARATDAGFGPEWMAALESAQHPRQKDMLLRMVELHMKANQTGQAEAIRAIAAQTGQEEDSVRRTVTRAKARSKRS